MQVVQVALAQPRQKSCNTQQSREKLAALKRGYRHLCQHTRMVQEPQSSCRLLPDLLLHCKCICFYYNRVFSVRTSSVSQYCLQYTHIKWPKAFSNYFFKYYSPEDVKNVISFIKIVSLWSMKILEILVCSGLILWCVILNDSIRSEDLFKFCLKCNFRIAKIHIYFFNRNIFFRPTENLRKNLDKKVKHTDERPLLWK